MIKKLYKRDIEMKFYFISDRGSAVQYNLHEHCESRNKVKFRARAKLKKGFLSGLLRLNQLRELIRMNHIGKTNCFT